IGPAPVPLSPPSVGARSTFRWLRWATALASSSGVTSSSRLPANSAGRSNGVPLSCVLLYEPEMSGSPQGVFGGEYGFASAFTAALTADVCAPAGAATASAPTPINARTFMRMPWPPVSQDNITDSSLKVVAPARGPFRALHPARSTLHTIARDGSSQRSL